MDLGNFVKQSQGFKAFVPGPFPPKEHLVLDDQAIDLLSRATLVVGRLDGITQLLPDVDFFIFMYVRKEASLSSQIEGTNATMSDSIKAENDITINLPSDVDDIQHYIQAMNFGLKKLASLPLSVRLLREVHKVLLTSARSTHFAAPGELRNSQNWIGGGSPATARFVPPPHHLVPDALGDLELFLHTSDDIPLLIKTGWAHAQFETIHPFLDGNGRTGRLLIAFYLCQQGVLQLPVLYISEYFKRHRESYFDLLEGYHNRGEVLPWIKFFLEGVAVVAEEAIETSRKINILREKDVQKVYAMGRSGKMGMILLQNLFKLPIVTIKKVQEFTGLSRPNATKLVDRFVAGGILEQVDKKKEYGRSFVYKKYFDLFK